MTAPIPPTATITCLCNQITIPLSSISKSPTLPLPLELCHCNSCSYTSGAISGAFIELASAPPDSTLSQCVEYASSERIRRYFCGSCGSKLFIRGVSATGEGMWFAWAGVVELGDDGKGIGVDVCAVKLQAFVEDTGDGGLLGRMLENLRVSESENASERKSGIEGQLETVHIGSFTAPTASIQELQAYYDGVKARVEDTASEKILAKCHCGNVQFYITRPDQKKEYPDNTQIYLKCNKTKYMGRLCTCRSCRSATGNPLHGWTYIPPGHIVTIHGSAIEFESEEGLERTAKVKVYRKDDATRSFCGSCGASVFYECEDRPWVVDVSVGILRSEAGTLAGDLLEWTWDQVSYQEECRDRVLLESVMDRK